MFEHFPLLQLFLLLSVPTSIQSAPPRPEHYDVKAEHPRLLIENVREIAQRCEGPLREDYALVKERADAGVKRGGVEFISNPWAIPEDLMNCGLAYLVEREMGRESRKYAEVILKQLGDGKIISNPERSHFGYHALAYDWIYDALSSDQRVRYGEALGGRLRYFTDKPEILLKWGHWEYNQTWGPIHLNIMNCRDALTQKLFIALTHRRERPGIAAAGVPFSRCRPRLHAQRMERSQCDLGIFWVRTAIRGTLAR